MAKIDERMFGFPFSKNFNPLFFFNLFTPGLNTNSHRNRLIIHTQQCDGESWFLRAGLNMYHNSSR